MYRFGPTEERDTIRYIDDSCSVKLGVSDFRDPIWWVNVMEAKNQNGEAINLTKKQLEEICYRISARYRVLLYENKIGKMKGEEDKINGELNILEIQ